MAPRVDDSRVGRWKLLGFAALLLGLGLGGCEDEGAAEPAPAPEPHRCAETFVWPSCQSIDDGMTLAAKASAFDQRARDEHLAPDGLLRNLYRPADLVGVGHWQHHPNVILWSGIYLASQALRYAVSGEPEAQENARTVVMGLRRLTEVTGVPGLYGRSMVMPGVAYDNDWPDWVASTTPGYEGWRWAHQVSKDGYDGLMFGYAAALEHFDDAELRADVADLVGEVGAHLYDNGLQIIDHDGLVTEHGRLFHSAFDDFPGFNAMLAASFIKVAAEVEQTGVLDDFYYGCLMQMRSGVSCPTLEEYALSTYIDSMESLMGLFMGNCQQSYDNFDMAYQAIYPLLRRETHPELIERLLGVLRSNMFHTEEPGYQSVATVGNTLYTFVYAALTCDGPDDPLVRQAVQDALCTLEAFPSEKVDRAIPAGTQEPVCLNRLDDPIAAEVIPLSEYYFDNYLWRLDPFEIQPERPGDPQMVYSPEDFLLVYWLGRYHGIIAPED